ncbi:hypothetical protein LINPERPRIM_LOCUS5923 [Linum perenne]
MGRPKLSRPNFLGSPGTTASCSWSAGRCSPNKDGSEKNVEVEKSTGSHDVANHQEIVGGSNGTATMIREAFVADTVETEKTLKRKKVYEDKGKAKVSELEKEPKKLLFGNKGIVIRVLDEEDSCEKDSSTPKN